MAREEAPPWPRGSTFFGIGGTTDANGGFNYLGAEWRHQDVTYGTNQYVTIRAVRNTGSFALLPGRMCAFDSSYPLNCINGYTDVSYQPGVILDELLPSGGLAANDIGYVIMEGPTLAWTPLDGGADNPIAFLDPLAAITAATSGATTAGRVATANTSGSTSSQRDSLLNVVGRAMSAKTTANTNTQVLVNVQRLF